MREADLVLYLLCNPYGTQLRAWHVEDTDKCVKLK